ncbi:MAG: hypothetical protein VYB81_20015 [Pseudomonadota bacterium]|nr:hypothetical protein [Pseudomonadota bacterium]|tara:strand:+ start:148 stop:483 length:336 start_codon:yes stop_codon:yes gene_type:complete
MDKLNENHSLIKEANRLFKENKFSEAEQFYMQAAKTLGTDLVEASIWLCKKRQNSISTSSNTNSSVVSANTEFYTAENFLKQKKQLEQTQQLLEEYYQQSQSLKLQLMQRN